MTDIQVALLDILRAIDKLCNDNKIRYSLVDRLAWDAIKFGNFHDKTYDAFICMEIDELKRFLALEIKNSSLRLETECICSTDDFDVHGYVRVVNSSTLLLDLDDCDNYRLLGISVGIKPLVASSSGTSFTYMGPDGRLLLLPRDLLEACDVVKFEDYEFPIFSDYDTFFTQLTNSSSWREQKYNLPIRRNRFGVIADTEIPFRQFIETVENLGLLTPSIIQNRRDFNHWITEIFKPGDRTPKKQRHLYRCSIERFRLWEKYYPHKAQLLELREKGEDELLESAFSDYLNVLATMYPKNLAVYFDQDLYSIARELFYRKNPNLTKNLDEMIPDTHKTNVSILIGKYES